MPSHVDTKNNTKESQGRGDILRHDEDEPEKATAALQCHKPVTADVTSAADPESARACLPCYYDNQCRNDRR